MMDFQLDGFYPSTTFIEHPTYVLCKYIYWQLPRLKSRFKKKGHIMFLIRYTYLRYERSLYHKKRIYFILDTYICYITEV